ncbi:hypothetical protein HK100_000114 [Physocladia obscura]|uniref:DUF1754-domain-containing protein n=1 Tax=Physocladia obscura TaxID=109957 RepID=A0AAD5T4S7_9FUNG|nr:hypothetical protein HK100_000114 [Physocladia obscura]
MSDAYFSSGGGLKLKGVASGSGVSKKKKKKAASVEKAPELIAGESEFESALQGDGGELPPVSRAAVEETANPAMTDAERRFEETRKKRAAAAAAKTAQKSHAERVQDLNKYLESLSEHHDIPRVGPG